MVKVNFSQPLVSLVDGSSMIHVELRFAAFTMTIWGIAFIISEPYHDVFHPWSITQMLHGARLFTNIGPTNYQVCRYIYHFSVIFLVRNLHSVPEISIYQWFSIAPWSLSVPNSPSLVDDFWMFPGGELLAVQEESEAWCFTPENARMKHCKMGYCLVN